MNRRLLTIALALLPLVAAAACHSAHVAITVENRTGAGVRLLEVDYPNASFGADALAAGADYHYRIQVIGEGQVKVQYTDAANHQVQVTGTKLAENDQGTLGIVLLPDGRAQFYSDVSRSR
jgi:hypothetical protein